MKQEWLLASSDYSANKTRIKGVTQTQRMKWVPGQQDLEHQILVGKWLTTHSEPHPHELALHGVWYKELGAAQMCVEYEPLCDDCLPTMESFKTVFDSCAPFNLTQETKQAYKNHWVNLTGPTGDASHRDDTWLGYLITDDEFMRQVREKFEADCKEAGFTSPPESLWKLVWAKALQGRTESKAK